MRRATWHDAVYDPESATNEADSAALLRALADAAGIPRAVADRIADLVESTHDHLASHGDAALLGDIDLAILGAPPERFARFEADIRREYARFDDRTYRAGRARVLAGFLERPAIYRTPHFAARLDARARTNLTGAIRALQPPEEACPC